MASGDTSILVGSYSNWPSTTVTIDGTGYEVTASSGGLYVSHSTNALNFMVQLKTHMDTELGGTNVVRLNKSGKMFISHSLGNFAITWTDSLAQTFSGFTQGNLSGASSYTADDVSPYIFIPGTTENPENHVLGVSGAVVWDVMGGVSRDGTTSTAILNSQRVSRIGWRYVAMAKFWDAADEDRHFKGLWDNVLIRGRKFFHYRNVAWDDSSTDAISLGTGLGPYAMNSEETGVELPFRRSDGFQTVDAYFDVNLAMGVTPEYTA